MAAKYIRSPQCFLTKKRKRNIALNLVSNKDFGDWLKKQDSALKAEIIDTGFEGKRGQVVLVRGKGGKTVKAFVGVNKPVALYDLAYGLKQLTGLLSTETIKEASFTISGKTGLDEACIGWALACYRFDYYQKHDEPVPRLVLPDSADKKRIYGVVEGMCLIRDLINTPPNHMGPAELEKAAKELAGLYDATVKVTGDKVLQKEFPLVFAVGDSSPRRPRLIDIKWGNPKHPKVTLVGKGVCFDTGGLDIKSSPNMAMMKKDMGGAAHALAVARMVMGLKLPIRLRVIIPAVENSISGNAFRPSDVFTSRKGIRVENTNTDAEGRLILADALTYACEDKPDIVIDFATLTGSARAALGAEIPAMFSTDDKIGAALQKISFKVDDPVWQMPLYKPYKKLIEGSTGELINSAGVPGDLIYSALFMESFLDGKTKWIHLDCYAWQHTTQPGKTRGGADTGMRAVFALLEDRYAK